MESPPAAGPPTPQPGEHRLAEPPSKRYAAGREASAPTGARGSALPGPLVRASLVAAGGAALIVIVGAILASTAGLLFAAGVTGAGTGLVLARAAVPGGGGTPITRGRVVWLAVALSLVAVAGAAVVTWLIARQEGGTLGVLDYLLETFGPFVPAEAVVAAVAAWWGASTGPVQR